MNIALVLVASIFLNTNLLLVERAFYVMGTILEFKLYCEDREFCNKAISDAYSEVKRLDDMLSNYKEDSELSEVNSVAGTGKIHVSPEFIELIERSLFFSNLTNGAFDITLGKLIELWRQGQQSKVLPDSETVKKTISDCVGFDKIKLHSKEELIEINSQCVSIDFGGIGKGYAIDRAVSMLKKKGVESGIINFGGEIFAIGAPPGGSGWRVGIHNPLNSDEPLSFIEVKDMAVSTSGNYERFFVILGKNYSHIIDPRTGMPVETVPSVTVLSKSATDADALSTAISVMGKDKSADVLKKYENAGLLIVTKQKNGIFIYKDSFFQRFEVRNSSPH